MAVSRVNGSRMLAGRGGSRGACSTARAQAPPVVKVDTGFNGSSPTRASLSRRLSARPAGGGLRNRRWSRACGRPPEHIGATSCRDRPLQVRVRRRLRLHLRTAFPERLAPCRRDSAPARDGVECMGVGSLAAPARCRRGGPFARQGVVPASPSTALGRFGFLRVPALSGERPDETNNCAYMDQNRGLAMGKEEYRYLRRQSGATVSPSSGSRRAASPCTACCVAPQARGLFHKASAVPGGLPGQRAHRPADARGWRRPELSGAHGAPRDRWGSKARTRRPWPACAPSAPSRSSGALRPRRGQTPILDGKLNSRDSRERLQGQAPAAASFLAGSNSADTAGNRIKATTEDEFFAHGKWSADAKAAFRSLTDADRARRADLAGQRGSARASPRTRFRGQRLAPKVYRFSYVASAMRERMRAGAPHGGEIGFVFGPGAGDDALARGRWSRSGAALLGQLRQDRRAEERPGGLAAARPKKDIEISISGPKWHRGRRPDPARRGSM